MTFISNMKLKLKHSLTPRDIYYSNLEEAYGMLPVPSDDWAEIKELITVKNSKQEENLNNSINSSV